MKNKQLLWVTTTAVLLALIVVAQLIPVDIPIVRNLITGSLVNMVLVVAVGSAGVWSGAALSVLSPLISLLLGQLPAPVMVPVVAVGNLAIVLVVYLFFRASSENSGAAKTGVEIGGIITGAVVKCVFLWFTTSVIIVPLLAGKATRNKVNMLVLMMSWPQLLSALIGGGLAVIVLSSVIRSIKSFNRN